MAAFVGHFAQCVATCILLLSLGYTFEHIMLLHTSMYAIYVVGYVRSSSRYPTYSCRFCQNILTRKKIKVIPIVGFLIYIHIS